MYGVLYAMTPELFPTKDRGTGNGIAATANRIFGIMAPIIALYADLSVSRAISIALHAYSLESTRLDLSTHLCLGCPLYSRRARCSLTSI
jgi:hypothetical protein